VTRKYPLDPLRRVREGAVDHKVRALSDSLRQVEAAREEAERTERRKRELENAVEATAAAERGHLSRGELTAADLARGAAWKLAKEIDRAEHARAVDQARGRHAAAETHAGHRRNELAEAKTSAELVTRHHEKWQRAEGAARDEEEAEQVYLGRRGRA
jgi:type III secretion system (T3SS) protein YscO